MHILRASAGVLITALFVMAASSNNVAASDARCDEVRFINDAAIPLRFQLLASELAMNRGTHAQVKQLAEEIANDHRKISSMMIEAAQSVNAAVPDSLDAARRNKLNGLTNVAIGKDFDARYLASIMESQNRWRAQIRSATPEIS